MNRSIRLALALALPGLFCAPASAVMQLDDTSLPEISMDLRPGHQAPSAEAKSLAASLKASVNWNQFGTVRSMIRHGGFLATGYAGKPADAAREWVRQNRALFRLSEAAVADLELVNEGVMPYTDARAVLFRQRFNGMRVSHDGLITVGIVHGKVYYVSSSSAGDQPPVGGITLTPLQAWFKAAANINRNAVLADVLTQQDLTERNGWHVFNMLGFSQPQRVRLVALPIPAGGVRQAYETIVLDQQAGALTAYSHFIDAETGAVLMRVNRMQNAGDAPAAEPFSGMLPASGACAIRHSFSVAGGMSAARIAVASVVPDNALRSNLWYLGAGAPQKVASFEQTAKSGAYRYAPAGGLAAGKYELEVCPSGAVLPPYHYVGTFKAQPAGAAEDDGGLVYSVAKWKWFPSTPDITFADTDVRKVACYGSAEGCDFNLTDLAASHQPWDMLLGVVPTFTSIGNNAITAAGQLNPLYPPGQRIATPTITRNYDFPFNNAWHASGCSLVTAAEGMIPVGNFNDVDATVINLFVIHNRMHDWSYNLGFTERNYNMQLSNFGLTGAASANDPELGNAQAGAVTGGYPLSLGRDNANQGTLPDGLPGLTNQFLFQPVAGGLYVPCVDGSFDMGIVGHEYTHAISNRMIGGPDEGIGGQQGGSMGESWGDQDATEYMFANGYLEGAANPTSLANYATGGLITGIRDFSLDDNPLNYSNIGFDTPGPEVHADGEIWNGTNWAMRKALVDKYQSQYPYEDRALQQACADGQRAPENCPGNRRYIQLMFDAFLLMPAAPSMLDARDAELAADIARFGGADLPEMWNAFARRGMGEFAYSIDGNDVAPVANFESPMQDDEAVVTFSASAADEKDVPVTNAKLFVGRFTTRSRWIADTDPATVVDDSTPQTYGATLNLSDTFKAVPGSYDFIVVAPGYGMHRFSAELKSGDMKLAVKLPGNWASLTRGATAAVSAASVTNASDLIDETEDTGALVGDAAPIAGASITVALAGGEQTVSHIAVSTAAGPNNAGRFNGVRAFEIRTCSGACADPVKDFENVAYTSAPDAIPGSAPRPLQPQLNLREFDFAPVKATHVQLRVLTSQCTGNPAFAGEQDNDFLNATDCPSSDVAATVRATEFEVFSHAMDNSLEPAKAGIISGIKGRFGGAFGLGLLLPLLGFAALRSSRVAAQRRIEGRRN